MSFVFYTIFYVYLGHGVVHRVTLVLFSESGFGIELYKEYGATSSQPL